MTTSTNRPPIERREQKYAPIPFDRTLENLDIRGGDGGRENMDTMST